MHALDNRRNVVVGKFRVLEGKTTLYRIDLCPLFLRQPATIDKELDSRWEVTGFSLGNRTAAPEIGPPRGEQGGPINYSDAEYSGAGSASMLAAASAWNGVAAELRSTALSYGAVLWALTDEEWHGPASAAMADAAAPYVAWMNTTAVQPEQAPPSRPRPRRRPMRLRLRPRCPHHRAGPAPRRCKPSWSRRRGTHPWRRRPHQ